MSTAPNPPADIRTVAKRARVSIATVSRVMNGITTVDPKLVARVVQAAEELNYTPNTQARALVSGKSGMIGLIISEITNPFFPELIQQFEDETVKRGYEMLIGSTNYSPSRMTQCIRRMVERKVEGVAVMTFGMDEDLLQELSSRGIPVVSVGSTQDLQFATAIEVNHAQGIHEAIQHLAVMGHRAISYIGGSVDLLVGRQRQQAYVDSMAQLGVEVTPQQIFQGDHTMDGGLAAAEQMFASGPMPTAVLCYNDLTAIGLLHSLSRHGLRVPEDISVVGFDDIHMAQFTIPPLTTIRMSCSDLATVALDALPLTPAHTKPSKPKPNRVVPTHLIVRQSTGFLRLPPSS